MKPNNYIVATTKEWHIKAYNELIIKLPGRWTLITDKKELSLDVIKKVNPKYIFFTHWSWLVDATITSNYQCVCFHPTDLPYGRGGSPLQNLIKLGHKTTKISAFKMGENIDVGDIYLKISLNLSGSAQEIFQKMASIYVDLIKKIITTNPTPKSQTGKPVIFKRRTPKQSQIDKDMTLVELYNLIRMLDAPTYPKAFLEYKKLRFEFTDAILTNNKICAQVKISLLDKKN